MANASYDGNNVPTLTAALNTTGLTVIAIKANPTNHALMIDDGTTGSNNGPTNALHDGNHIPTAMVLSSVDGLTKVPLYSTSDGKLLVDSN